MRKPTAAQVFVICLFAVCRFAGAEVRVPKGPSYDGIRSLGMGNTNVAVTTDRTAIFHNPAGLGLLKDRLQISARPLVGRLDGKVGSYVDLIATHGDKMTDIDQIAQSDQFFMDLDEVDGQWMNFEYIPEITIATKNLGFGMYGTVPFGARLETGHFVPKLVFKGRRDLVFTWGVGIPLKSEGHYFGMSLEYLQRIPIDEYVATFTENIQYADKLDKNIGNSLGIVRELGDVQHGASFDAGFMHNFGGFRLAYVVKDIFGIVGGNMVIPQLDIGCAYYFPKIEQAAFIRNIIVAMEIADLIGFEEESGRYEQFPKKLHAGAEIDLKYIALRGGINQGYPTFGVGLAFGPLTLDYVYFTEEAGFYAGQDPRETHLASIGFEINIEGLKNVSVGDDVPGVQ